MTENLSPLMALATRIFQDISEIDEHLTRTDQTAISFAAESKFDWELPPHLLEPQTRVLESCTELQALVEGPLSYLTRITSPRVGLNCHSLVFKVTFS